MYISRKLEYKIYHYLHSPEIIAIVGPRQSGKTTLLQHIAQKLISVKFISFMVVKILNLSLIIIREKRLLYQAHPLLN